MMKTQSQMFIVNESLLNIYLVNFYILKTVYFNIGVVYNHLNRFKFAYLYINSVFTVLQLYY